MPECDEMQAGMWLPHEISARRGCSCRAHVGLVVVPRPGLVLLAPTHIAHCTSHTPRRFIMVRHGHEKRARARVLLARMPGHHGHEARSSDCACRARAHMRHRGQGQGAHGTHGTEGAAPVKLMMRMRHSPTPSTPDNICHSTPVAAQRAHDAVSVPSASFRHCPPPPYTKNPPP